MFYYIRYYITYYKYIFIEEEDISKEEEVFISLFINQELRGGVS